MDAELTDDTDPDAVETADDAADAEVGAGGGAPGPIEREVVVSSAVEGKELEVEGRSIVVVVVAGSVVSGMPPLVIDMDVVSGFSHV